jgi:hypothetical protein
MSLLNNQRNMVISFFKSAYKALPLRSLKLPKKLKTRILTEPQCQNDRITFLRGTRLIFKEAYDEDHTQNKKKY